MKKTFITLFCSFLVSACAPDVGSAQWCDMMDDKSKGAWTTNDAAEYANTCVFSDNE